MKALLDEHFSHRIAQTLRERTLDVVAVSESPAELAEAPDQEVMEVARREERAVVTNNIKDFRPIAAERLTSGQGHAGLILVPSRRDRSNDATGVLADAIEGVMRAHLEGIPDAERWIAKRSPIPASAGDRASHPQKLSARPPRPGTSSLAEHSW